LAAETVPVVTIPAEPATAVNPPPEPHQAAVPAGHSASQHHHATTRGLDVFLIDSGWNTPVCKAVHENLPALAAYLKDQKFYVLTQEQSLAFIRRHPALVGADPILLVLDRVATAKKDRVGCGFRLCLGHVKQPEIAVAMLKWAMQLTMTANAAEMIKLIEQSGHRKSIQGVIELMGEGSAHLLEFAPI
jgi:hypothetical protein